MTGFFTIFDAYSFRARLFPAIIAAAPAFAAVALLISWETLGLSNAIATLGALVLLFAIADFARVKGRSVERSLYSEYEGMPSITMFRRDDSTIDDGSKERYRAFLASKLKMPLPTPEEERVDQKAADVFYEQCIVWLRQNTRNTKKFPLLFAENVTYGFRRNLLGVKWWALSINLIIVGICTFLLWCPLWTIEPDQERRVAIVLIVAAAHAIYMLFAVNKRAVWDAARAYARELILSCEILLNAPNTEKTRP